MSNDEFFSRLDRITDDFIAILQDTIKQLWNAQNHDYSLRDEYQVVFGLLSRHVTLTTRFIKAYSFWNNDMAPIIMRCLADNLINMKWIIGDISTRSDRFIKYGLGQEKLNIEHRKAQLLKDGYDPYSDPLIQAQERWLSTFRFPMLTDVDLGSWSGRSVRQMAIEADCLDFYNYVYMPFSCAIHSQWNHIVKFNMRESDNPLHSSLLYPVIDDPTLDTYYLILSAKYWDRALEWIKIWDMFNCPETIIGMYDWTLEKLKELDN